MNEFRFWAMYVSPLEEPPGFADTIRARGPNWRPIVVSPERAAAAAAAIQPSLVVIDAELPNHAALAETVLAQSASAVISDVGL